MGLRELQQQPGVDFRVTGGCPFKTGVCSVKSAHLSR